MNGEKVLSEATLHEYEATLARMKVAGLDLDGIGMDILERYFKESETSISSQNIMMSAILNYYRREGKTDNQVELDKMRNKIRQNRDTKKEELMENKMTERERKNYIAWSNVLLIHEKLGLMVAKDDSPKEMLHDYLLLSLYVYHPPRRLEDYLEMYVDDKEKIPDDEKCILWITRRPGYDEKKVISMPRTSKNYYTRNDGKGFFIFQRYKTEQRYGRQTLEVDERLNQIIRKYIESNGLNDGNKLFPHLSKPNFVRRLSDIFQYFCKRSMSASLIRHSYLTTRLLDPLISEKDKDYLGKMMAHSLGMQAMYRKIDEEPEVQEEIKAEILKERSGKWTRMNAPKLIPPANRTAEEKEEARREAKKRCYHRKKAKQVSSTVEEENALSLDSDSF